MELGLLGKTLKLCRPRRECLLLLRRRTVARILIMRVYLFAVLAAFVAQNIAAETADFALDANGNVAKLLVVEYREPSFGIDD